MRPAVAFVASLAVAAGCASDPPPRRAPPRRAPPPVAHAPAAPDLGARVAACDAQREEMARRSGWPSPDDRNRYAAAMRRAAAARAEIARAGSPTEEAVAAYEAACAEAWQLHQLFRVGEDARARPPALPDR